MYEGGEEQNHAPQAERERDGLLKINFNPELSEEIKKQELQELLEKCSQKAYTALLKEEVEIALDYFLMALTIQSALPPESPSALLRVTARALMAKEKKLSPNDALKQKFNTAGKLEIMREIFKIRLNAPSVLWPDHYKDLKTDLKFIVTRYPGTCPVRMLIHYSQEAHQVNAWEDIVAFQKAITVLDPGNEKAWSLLSKAYEKTEQLENAHKTMEEVERLERKKGNVSAFTINRLKILSIQKQSEVRCPKQYQELTPEEWIKLTTKGVKVPIQILINYSLQLQEKGKKQDTLKKLVAVQRRIVELEPENLKGWIVLALSLEDLGDYKEAHSLWRNRCYALARKDWTNFNENRLKGIMRRLNAKIKTAEEKPIPPAV